jgi:hypothetical protein
MSFYFPSFWPDGEVDWPSNKEIEQLEKEEKKHGLGEKKPRVETGHKTKWQMFLTLALP